MYKTFKKDKINLMLDQTLSKKFSNSEDLARIILNIIKPHW